MTTDNLIEELTRLEKDSLPINPASYRPRHSDDWGVVRSWDGSHVLQVRWTGHSEEHLNECRRNGTDPWGGEAKLFVSLRNHLPAILSALKENKRLREALVEIEKRLNCRGDADTAHYCPNCDNSMWNVRALARAALQPQGDAKP